MKITESEFLAACLRRRQSFLAAKLLGEEHPLTICQSGAGYYLGCWDEQGPVSRDSQHFPTKEAAQAALDEGNWEQRLNA